MQDNCEAASDGDVHMDRCGACATIYLARPAKINALRLATWRALRAFIVAADADPAVRVIVVRGAGKHFSAGNDIAALSTFPGRRAEAEAFAASWAEAIAAIEDASKPVVMAIAGVCYGAGLAMSLAGDVRVASGSAVFSIPVAKLGALYLRSDLQRLVATIGLGASNRLICSSDAIGAADALRIGLVDAVVAEAQFEAEVASLVDTIAARSAFSLRGSKAALRDLGHGKTVRESPASLAAFAEATQSADFAEGVGAFLAGRAARFG